MALVHGEGQDRWYFSKEELLRTPSVLSGIDSAKELSYRQQSANLIQDMGQRLVVSQLTINTAIVYMHRFYMFHSFSDMNRNDIAPCCLFLSAKLEEQPRKLEHVIKVANICLQKNDNLDQKSEAFQQQSQDLVINESILLQTLGFELTVDHPHTHVVKITQLVRASKDLAQTSYFMATNSLHLTPFCIQHKPSVVACVCIHLACKWSNWEFPRSSDNKDWWEYVDPNVTKETLDTICQEFLTIIENCPSRLKRRINNVTIYKGGHRTKPGEKSSGNSTSTNGDASKVKGKSPHKEGSSTKREQSSSEISKVEHVITTETPSNPSTERTHDVISSNNNSTSTVRITENAAVVETPTSTVMLPALQPLTTKYANMPGLSSNSSEHQSKSSNVHQKGPSVNKSKTIPGVKHKHREHDESDSPAKKLKTISSISSHSSQTKHLQRPSSQSKHSFHHTSSKPSSHAMSSLHHKAHLKSGSSGQHHNNFLPKVLNKNASHAQHSGSPKLPVRSSSSQGSSAVHHSSSKRQNHSGVPQSSHLHHRSNGNRALMPSSNKHSGSPGLVKKLSDDRHKRPPSTSSRPKPETTGFGTSSGFRSSEMDKGKKYSGEEFFSPPGPQRMPSLPTMPPMNFENLKSNNAPPLPTTDQTNPPPPPLPSNHPPSPPPPPT